LKSPRKLGADFVIDVQKKIRWNASGSDRRYGVDVSLDCTAGAVLQRSCSAWKQ